MFLKRPLALVVSVSLFLAQGAQAVTLAAVVPNVPPAVTGVESGAELAAPASAAGGILLPLLGLVMVAAASLSGKE